jgi:predicted SAM-dependent methyltransferase
MGQIGMIQKFKDFVMTFPLLLAVALFFYRPLARWRNARLWRNLARCDQIKLELGSGPKRGVDGWTTVDLRQADINYDLRQAIPLPDNSVEIIYSSHMFEHIPYRELIPFIGECKRLLKPGGVFSICVPNAGLYIKAYAEGRYFSEHDAQHAPAIVDTGSLLDQVNYMAYMGGQHTYMFDEENLINTLKKGGFEGAQLRAFDAAIDLESRDFHSIYAVATK